MKMNEETLRKACKDYQRLEGRASYYDVAVEIADTHPLQASIIILATWNVGRFRFYASDSKTLIDLRRALKECEPLFEKVKGEDFKTAKFDKIGDVVKRIYSILSKVKGVEYTGASKVIHLLNRDLFVMWDKDTREEYGYYIADGNDYLNFLKDMQKRFENVEWNMPNKTFAKAIDEYNQVTIAIPKRRKRRQKKSI